MADDGKIRKVREFGDDTAVHDALLLLAQLSALTNKALASMVSGNRQETVEILRANTDLVSKVAALLLEQQAARRGKADDER